MTPSLEGWPTKAKEAPSPHEIRLAPLDTNPVFQCLGEISMSHQPSMLCLRPATLSKKRLWYSCFHVNFSKFLRTRFLQNSSWQLLLRLSSIIP